MHHSIAIASDHAGVELKSLLLKDMALHGWQATDLGPGGHESVDYPRYAASLCHHVLSHSGCLGVLICGSGIGMSIAANRFAGIRAALCHDALSAQLSRRHNDANVLCLGARLIGTDTARDCLLQFITSEFEGGRHERRVAQLSALPDPL